ncbi:MAG: phosphoribosylformimino-5-aminoimidazole carboxamide ribotide isomerase [Firmicutes bacterium]|nr:phosphoribosylformimino-5-aminoimidazole carboxamide ribotide isomerase [Bacillota bacterium]
MKFRPCIDIHNGKVKQIVGGSLKDENTEADENYVSGEDAAFFAAMYKEDGLAGGHIIMLNPAGTPEYEADREQALAALAAFPGGMQIGGGITADNAPEFIDAGASHVIVTSYVFRDGIIHMEHLKKLVQAVGKKHIVLDLSCRKREGQYYIVTDRWQKFTETPVNEAVLEELSQYCDEFLIHGVDVEGKKAGIDEDLVGMLGDFTICPVTYAGGARSFQDIAALHSIGSGRVDVTIGSALDIFGGDLKYRDVVEFFKDFNANQV